MFIFFSSFFFFFADSPFGGIAGRAFGFFRMKSAAL
jgi:hypothetical protein